MNNLLRIKVKSVSCILFILEVVLAAAPYAACLSAMCKCLSAGPAADGYILLVRQAVAAEMGNRTAQQVQHYYRDNVQALKKGPWAADEDAALLKVCTTSSAQAWTAAVTPLR